MVRILVVRHAQSAWNAEGRWQGWADPPLSEVGDRQAAGAARRLPLAPGTWAASDLRRARRTAELLAGQGAPVLTDADLREYDAGAWTGMRRADIAARWPAELAEWDAGCSDAVPDGESGAAFAARLRRGVATVVEAAAAAGSTSAVVVSHGRAIHELATTFGVPAFYVSHLAGFELLARPAEGADSWRVVGPVDLLPPDLATPRRRPGEAADPGSR